MSERPYDPLLDGDVYLPALPRDLYPGVSEGPGIRIYTETSFSLAPSRSVIVLPPEATGASLLEAQRRGMDRDVALVRARMEPDILEPLWRELYAELAFKEARLLTPPLAMGKPLSRRARRRNRGRVRAAKAVLMRKFSPSVQWAWPDTARPA